MPLPKGYDKGLYGKVVGKNINEGKTVAEAHRIADRAVTEKAKGRRRKRIPTNPSSIGRM